MNGQLHKDDMKSRAIGLKEELYERCEKQDMTYQECLGAEQYLNKVLDVIEEYSY
jgi:hypothetical protein